MSEEKKKEEQGPSKMPDLKEIGAMAGKLFTDVKKSIGEIITDYKSKRPEPVKKEEKAEAPKPEEKPDTTNEEASSDSDDSHTEEKSE